jgi:hypothetical protein
MRHIIVIIIALLAFSCEKSNESIPFKVVDKLSINQIDTIYVVYDNDKVYVFDEQKRSEEVLHTNKEIAKATDRGFYIGVFITTLVFMVIAVLFIYYEVM